jgi:hypothetical protein
MTKRVALKNGLTVSVTFELFAATFDCCLIISLAQIWAATFIEFDVPLPLLAINECSDC